jgi:hypothetical protein
MTPILCIFKELKFILARIQPDFEEMIAVAFVYASQVSSLPKKFFRDWGSTIEGERRWNYPCRFGKISGRGERIQNDGAGSGGGDDYLIEQRWNGLVACSSEDPPDFCTLHSKG